MWRLQGNFFNYFIISLIHRVPTTPAIASLTCKTVLRRAASSCGATRHQRIHSLMLDRSWHSRTFGSHHGRMVCLFYFLIFLISIYIYSGFVELNQIHHVRAVTRYSRSRHCQRYGQQGGHRWQESPICVKYGRRFDQFVPNFVELNHIDCSDSPVIGIAEALGRTEETDTNQYFTIRAEIDHVRPPVDQIFYRSCAHCNCKVPTDGVCTRHSCVGKVAAYTTSKRLIVCLDDSFFIKTNHCSWTCRVSRMSASS